MATAGPPPAAYDWDGEEDAAPAAAPTRTEYLFMLAHELRAAMLDAIHHHGRLDAADLGQRYRDVLDALAAALGLPAR